MCDCSIRRIIGLGEMGMISNRINTTLDLVSAKPARLAIEAWAKKQEIELEHTTNNIKKFAYQGYKTDLVLKSRGDVLFKICSDEFQNAQDAEDDAFLAAYYRLVGWDISVPVEPYVDPNDPARKLLNYYKSRNIKPPTFTFMVPNDGSKTLIAFPHSVPSPASCTPSSKSWHHSHNAIRDSAERIIETLKL